MRPSIDFPHGAIHDRRDLEQPHDRPYGRHEDRGAILNFVLVTIVVCSLIAIPVIGYLVSVLRSGEVQSDKAQALALAEGGTWVAVSNEGDLFDMCDGGELPSSLSGVTTTCTVLETTSQHPESKVPFAVATVRADTTVPPQFSSASAYTNPNVAADPSAWLTAGDSTALPTAGKVWLPQLPVQSIGGGARVIDMPPGTFDPSFASCRVLFPGTFTTPLVLDGPTYFTSGVYYFTQPIILRDGADVVVGNGSELGCTDDFEGAAPAVNPPSPLNIGGLGGTLVFGAEGRITVEDSGTGKIALAINQRYVATGDESATASAGVSIVSVNGDHAPFAGAEVLGGDLIVPGVITVPASTVATAGGPLAVNSGYLPSTLTPKPVPPDVAPRIPDAIVDLTTTTATELTVTIAGYVAVPQGRIAIGASDPSKVAITMTGGVLAGQIDLDQAQVPSTLAASFDNPVGQKRVRIRSVATGDASATSEAVIQVNRSGSIGINSWIVRGTPSDSSSGGGAIPGAKDFCSTDSGWSNDVGSGAWTVEYWNLAPFVGSAPADPFPGAPVATTTAADAKFFAGFAAPPGATGVNADFYSSRWTRTFNASTSCAIDLRLAGDDGYRIFLDGVEITSLSDWSIHGHRARTANEWVIPAGEHTLVIEHYETILGSSLELAWRKD